MRAYILLLSVLIITSCKKLQETSATVTPVLKDFNLPAKAFGDAPFELSPPTSESNGAFTYTTDNSNIVSITGSQVTILRAGTCNITAKQAASGKYAAASIYALIIIQNAAPAITNFVIPDKTTNDKTFTLQAPNSNSAGAFRYYSSTPSVATVSGNVVTITGAGKTTITVVQDAYGNYEAAQASAVLTVTYEAPLVTDFDGNTYKTITIGTQTWMQSNLKTTHYRDGTPIPNLTDGNDWLYTSEGAYCDLNNDANLAATYGKLYNWNAVNSTHKLAPAGWHVPTQADWQQLYDFIGGNRYTAYSLMSVSTLWFATGATNTTGFSAIPGGYRGHSTANGFDTGGAYAIWWSSTQTSTSKAWMTEVYVKGYIELLEDLKNHGFSVRCIKD